MRVCLVSREVAPFAGGGIGVYILNLARVLSSVGEVRIVTDERFRPEFEKLRERGQLPYDEAIEWTFVPAPSPTDVRGYGSYDHAWSAFVLQALERAYEDNGPDLIEFPDYRGEAFVTLQAKRSRHRTLGRTRVCVRLHTSGELAMALNGCLSDDPGTRCVVALERYCLTHADTLLWAGGDILDTYRRYYGEDCAATAQLVRHPLDTPSAELRDRAYDASTPLRFLYFGRLERRKGVQNLVRAFAEHPWRDWELTLLGGDTDTGELGTSMRAQLELATRGDERVHFLEEAPRSALTDLIRGHDVVVVPSRWECWPYVCLETLALNRPVLATPVGGLTEMVEPDRTGWLTADVTAASLTDAVGGLLDDLPRVTRVVRSGRCAGHARQLTDSKVIANAYEELASVTEPAARRTRPREPLVSVVVPYYRLPEHVEEAVASAAGQTHRNLEIIVVNDGSFASGDAILDRLVGQYGARVVHQPNLGLSHARNTGIRVSRGRYVFPLDADNIAEPTFVERCVALLEADASLAYVTSWSLYIDVDGNPLHDDGEAGYQPLGNFTDLVSVANWAGDAAAVWPRRLFDLGMRYSVDRPIGEDWMLYQQMRAHGHIGHVIPERLIRYRIRPDSMYREGQSKLDRLRLEITTELALERVRWTARHTG
jgi:glycogen synthase